LLPIAAAHADVGGASAAPVIIVVSDTTDGHGWRSLRGAVDLFNASSGRPGLIVVSPGEYDLTACGAPDDANRTGDLDLLGHGPLTIVGAGHVKVKQTCPGERVVDDHGANALTLANVTITGGDATSTDPAIPVTGGAVRAAGAVTLFAATIRGNRARAPKGADATATTTAQVGGAAHGGAVAAGGPVVVYASTVSANTASAGAGGNEPANDAKGLGGAASGGAIATTSSVRLIGSTLSGNQALGGAGSTPQPPGVFGFGAAGGSARGGAVDAQTVSVRDSTLGSNNAVGGDSAFILFSMAGNPLGRPGGTSGGGAIAASGPVTVSGSTFHADTAFEGAGAFPVGSHGGAIVSAGAASVSNSTFDANVANRHGFSAGGSFGGGISTGAGLRLTHDTLTNNVGENGGAVHAAGPLTAHADTFRGNQATKGGAAHTDSTATVSNASFSDNHVTVTEGSAGGGLYAAGAVLVTRSSFSGNHLDHGNPSFPPLCHFGICFFGDIGAHGGAVASGAAIGATESTFSDNSVQGGLTPSPAPTQLFGTATGGALAAPTIVVADSTITGNGSVQEGVDPSTFKFISGPGLGAALDVNAATLTHVTLTDSSGLNAINASTLTIGGTVLRDVAPVGGTECLPTVATTSEGYNFSDDASCRLTGVHDIVTTADPLLGPLAENGGPTRTRLPAAGSLLVNVIPTSDTALCSGTDQRGISRPQGPACDVGSVEVVGIASG